MSTTSRTLSSGMLDLTQLDWSS